MILESAQLLCACHHIFNSSIKDSLYKLTHKNHPSTLWVCESKANYEWLYKLFMELCEEYTYRYGRIHRCQMLFEILLKESPEGIPDVPMTLFALAMPEEIKNKYLNLIELEDDFIKKQKLVVKAYREYYMKYKKDFCSWKGRDVPNWFVRDYLE
jgi:hypothetical protein